MAATGSARLPPASRRRSKTRRSRTGIGFGEAFRVWLRIALLSFGGPAGQIAVMHRMLVEEKRWVSESAVPARAELLHAAARPRGAAARDLYRLADAPDAAAGSSPAACSCCPASSR